MKKPEFLKKANWIDLLVIIGIALVVIMGVYHVSPYSEETESEAYDVATIDKATPKYLDFYNRGEVVKTHIAGTNVSNGNTVVLDGVITWSDENPNDKYIQMLVNGEKGKVLIGSYKSTPNADVYINQMTICDISERMHISIPTAKRWHREALEVVEVPEKYRDL